MLVLKVCVWGGDALSLDCSLGKKIEVVLLNMLNPLGVFGLIVEAI